MSDVLEKAYDPQSVEPDMLAAWEASKAFQAQPDDRTPDKRFVVMIPLPNVTGTLHLGHAINNTLQDIVTRRRRMMGCNSLYQPGTDHAGIATQAVVERRIFSEEKKTRHDIGRQELVRRIWEWKDQYEKTILGQLKRMGCSCDWDRVRFTLDDRYSDSVHETFFRWFQAGLIYRGERLVNWDTELRTAVSDDEVYHETVKGHFWHFKYRLKDPPAGGPTHLGFATTRPETMLGDVALAVNPTDERYKALVGRSALVPLFDPPREIPIVADEWADPEKGTGCVKITPAHDPNDYAVGIRHGLPMINIMTPDRCVSESGGKYSGMKFADARKAIVADMEALELLDSVEDLDVQLPHSDRSKSAIEPYLSPQWFVRMGDIPDGVTLGDKTKTPGLAQAAMDAVNDGRVRITPERYKKTYVDWLSEKRDWCISRQLWWGHRIPVWSTAAGDAPAAEQIASEITAALGTDTRFELRNEETPKGERVVTVCLAREDESAVSTLESAGFAQDPDVLDTWFSSQLWPYATLGWPEKTPDLDFYYPGSVLITSRDIITLWVARMVLSGLYNIGKVPFRDVYIHPKILDGRGETMSKSKGNGVDPLDVIAMYGTDAMRYALTDMTTETQDVRMPVEYRCPHCAAVTKQTAQNMQAKTVPCKGCKKKFATRWADEATVAEHGRAQIASEKFEIGRNFCNKLWNAARFAFMNIEGVRCDTLDVASLPTEDQWILAKLSETIRRVHEDLDRYRFSASIKRLRDFFWEALCDWYIELTKARMSGGERSAEAKQVLAFCMDQILRLLHPCIPFVTERLWGQLNTVAPQRGLPGLADPAMNDLLITAEFPPRAGWSALENETIVATFETLQSVTRAVRELRQRNNAPPKESVTVTIRASAEQIAALRDQGSIVQRLANVGELHIAMDATRPPNSGTVVLDGLQVFVHDIADDAVEGKRLETEMSEIEKQIAAKENKLANDGFVRNAKPEVVQAERERLATLNERRATLQSSLALLR